MLFFSRVRGEGWGHREKGGGKGAGATDKKGDESLMCLLLQRSHTHLQKTKRRQIKPYVHHHIK
jgi:hypothetical protein